MKKQHEYSVQCGKQKRIVIADNIQDAVLKAGALFPKVKSIIIQRLASKGKKYRPYWIVRK